MCLTISLFSGVNHSLWAAPDSGSSVAEQRHAIDFDGSLICVNHKSSTRSKTGAKSAKSSTNEKKSSSSAAKNISAWELSQSSRFVGPVSCLIASDAVRIRADKMGITWLFRAPSWEAFIYNTETKNFCSFPYEIWKNKVFFMPPNKGAELQSKMKRYSALKTGETMTIAGQKAYEVNIKDTLGKSAGSIWMAKDISAPKQFSEVIGSMVNVPLTSGGAPLTVMMRGSTGKVAPVLETSGVAKKDVQSELFKPLTGYSRVKDEMALIFAEGPDGGGSLFDEDLGVRGGKSRPKAPVRKTH